MGNLVNDNIAERLCTIAKEQREFEAMYSRLGFSSQAEVHSKTAEFFEAALSKHNEATNHG